MASKPHGIEGVHFVRRRLASGITRWHVYAWRGGPKIMEADGVRKPALTPDALTALVKAQSEKGQPRRDTFEGLAVAYLGSPDFRKLADYTRRDYRIWIDRARLEFGRASLRLFSDLRMRGSILEWRDKWAHAPRQAAYAMQVLSRVLSWGLQRGWVMHNPAAGMPSVYKADRSDVVWEDHEIEAVAAEMNAHVVRAFKLAAWTGLSRGDLVTLRWDEIKETHIERRRSKTGVEQIIPLFDETSALLANFPKSAVTVVTNHHGKPFTPRGLAMAVERARSEANEKRQDADKVAVGKTLHDIRGTFATRLMRRGFEDRDIDEIMGWETGKSARIRRRYISRRAVVISAIVRMREKSKKGT